MQSTNTEIEYKRKLVSTQISGVVSFGNSTKLIKLFKQPESQNSSEFMEICTT